MRYTQQQALAILAIEQSTFVYWMRAVPRIRRLKGRGCHFERHDLLALGVLGELTREVGIGIKMIAPIVPQLFDLFHDVRLLELELMALVVEQGSVRLARLPFAHSGTAAVTVLPLQSLVAKLLEPQRAADLLPLEQLMHQPKFPGLR